MVNRFSINGVTYTAKPFDFDMLCELEAVGVNIQNLDKMSMSLLRGFFAVCADIEKDEAAALIQKHVINGGNLENISNALAKEMDESDFFRALSEKAQTGTEKNLGESETEKSKKGKKLTSTEEEIGMNPPVNG